MAGTPDIPTPAKEPLMRKLALHKDVLVELTTDELVAVVGADATGIICITDPCITNPATYLGCASRQTHC